MIGIKIQLVGIAFLMFTQIAYVNNANTNHGGYVSVITGVIAVLATIIGPFL